MNNQQQPVIIPAFDLVQIGAHGGGQIRAEVRGYWSRDPVSVTIEREFNWKRHEAGEPGTWKASFSHSSGGRSTDEEADDLAAAANFALAMQMLVTTARGVLAQHEQLEAAWSAERARRNAEEVAAKAAKQAAIDADPAMGDEGAKAIIEELIHAARTAQSRHAQLRFYERGVQSTDRYGSGTVAFYAEHHHSGHVTLRMNGTSASRKAAAERLAALSQRSAPVDTCNLPA